MLVLRRLRLSSSSRYPCLIRSNSSLQGSSGSASPTSSSSKIPNGEILLNPTTLRPQERRSTTFPKPLPKKASLEQDQDATAEAGAAGAEQDKSGVAKTDEKASKKAQAAKSIGRRRKRQLFEPPRKRPQISLDKKRKWNRPLAEGVLPAYDEALKVIWRDSLDIKDEARKLKKLISAKAEELEKLVEKDVKEGVEGASEETVLIDAELEKMREKLNILEVQSEVNSPSVRWTVANAMSDMTIPSHRHLVEQRWRSDGKLDLLMERIHQMNVVPDVLPVVHPSVDLDVTVRFPLNKAWKTKKRSVLVEPGIYLTPTQTIKPPTLFPHAFHTDVRLYTMLMVDPDVPDEENRTFTTFLHWMKPNIPISATHRGFLPSLNTHTVYVPPHPQRGTPYHRYTIFLLPQPPKTTYSRNAVAAHEDALQARGIVVPESVHPKEVELIQTLTTSKYLDIPVVADRDRLGFSVREFVKTWGLNAAKGGGCHMFRQVWDETVSGIYEVVHGEEEPRYGLPPKHDPYAAVRGRRRYV